MNVPQGRTGDYAIWRACERLGMLPPGVKSDWDANEPWTKALIIAYSQIREYEDAEAVRATFPYPIPSK